MNYLQIDGKQYPFKFTFSKIIALSKMHGVDYVSQLDKVVNEMSLESIPEIITLGLEGGAQTEDKACDFDAPAIRQELEKDQSLIGRAMKVITDDITAAFVVPGEHSGDSDESEGKHSAGAKYKK